MTLLISSSAALDRASDGGANQSVSTKTAAVIRKICLTEFIALTP
jgi:hypothetical protein